MVPGILFDMSEKELKLLDKMEVFKGNYKRETFLTLGEDRQFYHADLYRVIEPGGPFTPSRSYVEIILEGAREHRLDPDNVKKIQAFYDRGKFYFYNNQTVPSRAYLKNPCRLQAAI